MSERSDIDVPERARPRDRRRSELRGRILVAVPAVVVAYLLVVQTPIEVFALGMFALGVVALHELYGLMRRARPVDLAGYLSVAGMLALAAFGEREQVLIALAGAFPLVFALALLRPRMEDVSWAAAATVFGIVWIGLPLAHAVFLRELPHGDGLLVDVLIGTFVGDTAAYAAGRAWGRTALAPDISPNKTIEGLVAGVLAATLAFWAAGTYQDWLSGTDALIIGVVVALVAPIGDLFESALKRDLEVKDTGRAFGAHGGALDRLDAALFTVVVAYYAALALGYG